MGKAYNYNHSCANSGAYLRGILEGQIPKSQIQREGFPSGTKQVFKKWKTSFLPLALAPARFYVDYLAAYAFEFFSMFNPELQKQTDIKSTETYS